MSKNVPVTVDEKGNVIPVPIKPTGLEATDFNTSEALPALNKYSKYKFDFVKKILAYQMPDNQWIIEIATKEGTVPFTLSDMSRVIEQMRLAHRIYSAENRRAQKARTLGVESVGVSQSNAAAQTAGGKV